MDLKLVDLRVAQDLLDGLESRTEEVLAKFLKTCASEGGVEINALEE